MGAASATQAALCVRGGEIYDCPHLVVLSFLDPGLFAAGAWFTSDANRSAHPRDLCHIRSRERCWRVALIEFDTAGILRECSEKMGDVPLCAERPADCHRLPPFRVVVRHPPDWTCRGRSSRPFCQSEGGGPQ